MYSNHGWHLWSFLVTPYFVSSCCKMASPGLGPGYRDELPCSHREGGGGGVHLCLYLARVNPFYERASPSSGLLHLLAHIASYMVIIIVQYCFVYDMYHMVPYMFSEVYTVQYSSSVCKYHTVISFITTVQYEPGLNVYYCT